MLLACIAVPAMAQEAVLGGDNVDILRDGIFESEGNAFQFPIGSDTNYDSLDVGNDRATAFGVGNSFPFGTRNGPTIAENNLEIKKNQNSGDCAPCEAEDGTVISCTDSCLKVNIEQIKVGDRTALAIGSASAKNNIKIVTNQN